MKKNNSNNQIEIKENSRRAFLKTAGLLAASAAALSTTGCSKKTGHGKNPVRWGMIVDTKKCVGCYSCVVSCKAENHTPPGVAYNVLMEEEVGTYPNVRRKFVFKPCMQCESSSCTTVCPTGATYHRDDGIVAIDYDKCIGCRYCIEACPYGSRSFDYGENYSVKPTAYEMQPSPEYGENRNRQKRKSPIGNVRKCTFCVHKLKKGLNPACAETCMGHAIHFGNFNDPNAKCLIHGEDLHELLVTRGHKRLKVALGNEPAVYYLT